MAGAAREHCFLFFLYFSVPGTPAATVEPSEKGKMSPETNLGADLGVMKPGF